MTNRILYRILSLYKLIKNIKFLDKLFYSCIFLLLICIFFTYKRSYLVSKDPISELILADLILVLIILTLYARNYLGRFFLKSNPEIGSKLQTRIITVFSLLASIPTLIVAVFSSVFFDYNIQLWFDKKVNTLLETSIKVADSYIIEHKNNMKTAASEIIRDIEDYDKYYGLLYDINSFNIFLNKQANMRSIPEAIVFSKEANMILAQTSFTFSLSFMSIPIHFIERADKGEAVEINNDPYKIRILIKSHKSNLYLLIGKFIDNNIIDYVDKTNGSATEYLKLKNNIQWMQAKFAFIFIALSLILLIAAILFGVIFTGRIIKPIQMLVRATYKVQQGDWSVQIEEPLRKDEISILTAAFNKMINTLQHQKHDLAIAQRTAAWVDVAKRVAHEIKNPLTPIQLSAERLRKKYLEFIKEEDKEQFNRYINTILRHNDDIKGIVSEFVEFAKLPSPIFEKADIVSLLKEMIEIRKSLSDNIDYKLESFYETLEFICDPKQINRLLINLFKNAEESISSSLSTRKDMDRGLISIKLEKIDNKLIIDITDNGEGFPENLIDKVIEPYVTTTKGMGLGLAIVKKIVEDHFGIMKLSNNKGPQDQIIGAHINIVFKVDQLNNFIKNNSL